MQTDRVLLEASVEYLIKSMTPWERVARVRALREKARREYLPRYLEMMQQANGSASVIDGAAVHDDDAANDDDDDEPVVGELAAQPEPSAGLGSEPRVNGGGHVDQPRRANLGWPGDDAPGDRERVTDALVKFCKHALVRP